MTHDPAFDYPDLKNLNKILIIQLKNLGDLLLTTPLFSCLKGRIPKAKIDLVTTKETASVVAGNPHIHHHYISEKGYIGTFSLLRQLKKEKYDLVLHMTEGDRGAILTWATGARIKVGLDPHDEGFWGKKKIYTHLVKRCASPRHKVERNMDAMRRIGIFPSKAEMKLYFHVNMQTKMKMEEEAGSGFILLHPTARWFFKAMRPVQINLLIQELLQAGEKVVLTSGGHPKELRFIEEALQGMHHPHLLNLSGKTTLEELGALMLLAKKTFTMDSLSLHIASALQVPHLTIFGPTDPRTWGPWNNPYAEIFDVEKSCHPCFLDGCGGSKISVCLTEIDPKAIAHKLMQKSPLQDRLAEHLHSSSTL